MLRHRAGMTRDDVAQAAGLSGGTLSRIEQGRTAQPSFGTLRALLRVLCERAGENFDEVWQRFGELVDADTRMGVLDEAEQVMRREQ